MFYHAYIESVLLYGTAAWFGNLTLTLRSQVKHLVHTAIKVVGTRVYTPLQSTFNKIVLRLAKKITLDPCHVLYAEFELLPSGRCYRMPRFRHKCNKNDFVPLATGLFNSNVKDIRIWLLTNAGILLCGLSVLPKTIFPYKGSKVNL